MTDTQNTPVEQATEAVSALRVVDGVTLPAAGTYVLDPTHTRIGFVARHLMVTKVRGAFREFTGSDHHRRGPHRLHRRGHPADRLDRHRHPGP